METRGGPASAAGEERLTDLGTVRGLLARHGFRFSKKLGQNFLVNPSVCPRMAEACGADADTGVLEIGPGIGVLTRELARRAARVTAVELDGRLLPVLAETLAAYPNARILQGDAMELDLHRLIGEAFVGLRVAVCANLPYYITSPLLMRLLESRLPVDNITVMVQKEAAQRLCARPGTRECGAVTLAVRYYAQPEVLFPVSRGSFLPAPNVDSAVIRLVIRKAPPCPVRDEALLFRLVRAAFGQRRKTLPNALTGAGVGKAAAAEWLRLAGIPETARAEQLTLEQFAGLANAAAEHPAL
ncbi:MAG TPA: 16S rRNA (adenine(1518)-N(6)/adenine(1519)-N(6))-dimethyltransferase RsmA [Firmicutes bacterium]|nr:16S rRNA (adenine(1518)-N(6)/adenine(1519)-N(6))-dimethyltransferase RsmA [Bacillota bacterium]